MNYFHITLAKVNKMGESTFDMKKELPNPDSLGAYLRRLRESKNLSLREAARHADISSAYLSQVEGGKRGKRKGSADHFGPHPQILKKLAEAYNIPANDLFTLAGYLDEKENSMGFSEERETDRLFDFVIHDAMIKRIFTVVDKRAVINRYEKITGKRLITWAGDFDLNPSVKKTEFSGLRCEDGMLCADTPFTDLTLEEVAQELATDKEEVEIFIANGWLDDRKDVHGNVLITKDSLRGFKDYAMRDGLQLRRTTPKRQRPNTATEFRAAKKRLEEIDKQEMPEKIRKIGEAAFKRHKPKSI
jgi:HTH-type transcriptional regulator, competence development regulator